MERTFGAYVLSTDKDKLDVELIHHFLSEEAYWSQHISRDIVVRAIKGAMCFGIFHEGAQVGFARVITDNATFGYLADVFIVAAHRGKGLSKWMMECIMSHPDLQGMRRFMLATRDAHALYAQFGFQPVAKPESLMQVLLSDPYPPAAAPQPQI